MVDHSSANRVARGGCPRCGKTVPFLKAGIRRGKAFACTDCGAQLTTVRGRASGAVALFCLASAAARIIPPALVMLILVVAGVIDWLTAKVYLVAGDARVGEAPDTSDVTATQAGGSSRT
ncbi:MAG TPA: hypothetical protein VF552_03300 [Allosphingosinicella sp.]|jgi:DNA-directed RNA polymerase subunit RPC12/RpoP